ncbi:MAG: photosynthetic protein synthase I, partial [Actinobacteria bacterium]|nr:photosynthetic protein synthase I [Actinomycetota bacterium]
MGNPSIGRLLTKLRKNSDYSSAFDEAFPGEGVTITTLGRAIAAFEATMLRGNSQFDKAIFGGQRDALSQQEWRGYQIFISKGGCSSCHSIGEQEHSPGDDCCRNMDNQPS